MHTKNTRNELARLVMGTIFLVGERAKRARRYLVMFMETRDILYIYVRLFLIPMHAFSRGYPDPPSVLARGRVSVLRIKFKS